MDGAANVGETERGDAAIQYGALQHGLPARGGSRSCIQPPWEGQIPMISDMVHSYKTTFWCQNPKEKGGESAL